MALANRLAIIAGGVGGIGSATGKLLRSQGAKLALLYAPFEANQVKSILKDVYGTVKDDSVKTYACDITSPNSVRDTFQSISSDNVAFPNILINSAGYVNLTPLEDTPSEDALKHYMINVHGPMLTAQAFVKLYLKHQIASKAPSNVLGGRIVNIASQAGHVALHHHGAYCASKAGLIGLTKCMASEWGAKGITANTVSPGPVWTTLGKKAWADKRQREEYQAAVPTGKFAEPEEVASIISFFCQESSMNINGTDVKLDGGYTAR